MYICYTQISEKEINEREKEWKKRERKKIKERKNPVSHQRKDETFCNLEQSVTSD